MDTLETAPLTCQRDLFDVPADILYLNNASKSVLPRATAEAGQAGAALKGHPWDIDDAASQARAEDIRGRFARLIGTDADDIAFHPSAAYGIATATANLNPAPGSRILVLEGQFPSNVYAWQRLAERSGAEVVTVPWPADGDWTASVLGAIDERIAIAALPPGHWTDGARLDLIRIGAALKAVGATFLVDATQWVGAAPFDVAEIGADFVVCAAYKWLLGPYGTSLMYFAPKHQDGRPLEDHLLNHGGTASITGGLGYPMGFTKGARRYDVGQFLNLVSLPMLQASLTQIEAWGPARIQAYLAPVTDALADACAAMGLHPTPKAVRSANVLGVRRDGGFPADLPARLAARGVYAIARGGALRLSPYLYNEARDAERFAQALESALKD